MITQLSQDIASNIIASKEADHARQDAAADKVAAILDGWYIAMVRASTQRVGLSQALDRIYQTFAQRLFNAFIEGMSGLAAEGQRDSAEAIINALPDKAKMQLISSLPSGLVDLAIDGETTLTEAIAPPPGLPPSALPPSGLPYLEMPRVDLAKLAQLSRKQIDAIMRRVIFAPMTRKQIQGILFQAQAVNRIAPITQLVTPQRLISVISQAQSKGMNRAQIAKQELEPIFQTTKSDAKRVARTTGALIANQSNMQAFQGLGDLLVGYQVHCVTDKNSRPWHQARKNEVYKINPKEGEKGLKQMPRPPYEPEDPAERPAGTPEIAHNCRCFLSPVCRKL